MLKNNVYKLGFYMLLSIIIVHINVNQSFAAKLIYSGTLTINGSSHCTGTLDLRKYKAIRIVAENVVYSSTSAPSITPFYIVGGQNNTIETGCANYTPRNTNVSTCNFDIPGDYMYFCTESYAANVLIYGSD